MTNVAKVHKIVQMENHQKVGDTGTSSCARATTSDRHETMRTIAAR